MKKTRLNVDYEYDFELIGLISSFKDYKIAWHLNNILNVQLAREEDIHLTFTNYKLIVSNFAYISDHNEIRLLKNNTLEPENVKTRFLIPELKHIDYFIQVKSNDGNYIASEMIMPLRKTPGVELAMIINVEELKSKENFIYD